MSKNYIAEEKTEKAEEVVYTAEEYGKALGFGDERIYVMKKIFPVEKYTANKWKEMLKIKDI